ncbi:transcriptional regulator [Amycolatopsis sp. NBC_01307]|uniref:transcriptional regulator n=1 Tax=Amycolatopsis sp. NBC_01307 TaxID=2903561 RepID=UPI002E1638F6|nr:transcriptional regulator [Amycolatopsis sp. NBC_01307]
MIKDYGRPPRSDENQSLIERRLKEVTETGGPRETQTVDWRGGQAHLDVIQLPAGDLYYNPATHRIRAQRSHDPQLDQLVDEDPWSSESQDYLGYLLQALPADPSRTDPTFTELLESLREYDQTEPGLITRDGVLVNGNTRRAAMLKMGGPQQPIRVAVLPESCDWEDIRDVELSLQLRKEHRRDYSYINRLLAIDELVNQGLPIAKIAAIFRTTVPACKQDQWVFASIKSLIERSEVNGHRIPLVAFEDHQEKLKELHRRYRKDLSANGERAELTKESRLAAIMLGFSKTDVRFIESDFQSRYLDKVLPAELKPESASATVAIPGLGVSVKGASDEVAAARELTNTVLKARTVEITHTSGYAGEPVEEAAELKEAMNQAIERAGRQIQLRKRKQAAPDRLNSATAEIDQCITELVMSRASRALDEEAFNDALLSFRRSLRGLAVETSRTVEEQNEGVAWLRQILELES